MSEGIWGISYNAITAWSTLGGGLVTSLAAAVAAAAIINTGRINKTNQLMTVWQHCASRYDTLKTEMQMVEHPTPHQSRVFWSRYWGLKNDQFDFWLYGYLDHDTFCDWAFSTLTTIGVRGKEEPFQLGIAEYLTQGGTINPLFDHFIETLWCIAEGQAYSDAEKILVEDNDNPLDVVRYNSMMHYISQEIVGPQKAPRPAWKVRNTLAAGLSWKKHKELMHSAIERSGLPRLESSKLQNLKDKYRRDIAH